MFSPTGEALSSNSGSVSWLFVGSPARPAYTTTATCGLRAIIAQLNLKKYQLLLGFLLSSCCAKFC